MCCLAQYEWETECIEEPDPKTWVLKVLEPDAGKLARPVLRGGSHGNMTFLPDNIAVEQDPQGNTTQTFYTALRAPYRIIHPDRRETRHIYNKNGTLARALLPNGTELHYSYDIFQRITLKKVLSQERDVLTEERFTYNTFHLVDHTNTLGLKTIYHYDKAGRLIREETEERKKSYTYDSLGFLERTSDGAATHVEIHDVMGRVIQEWTEDNVGRIENKTTYTYENNRKKTAQRETSQGDALDQFFYDSEGQLERHIDPNNHVSQFIYKEIINDLGQKVWTKKIVDPKGNATLETYDVAGKVVRLQHLNTKEETVAQEIIFYDRAGNKAKSLHTIYEKASPIKTITITWCYDSMGRLIQEVEAGQKTTAYRYFIEERKEEKTLPNSTILTTLFDGLGRPLELKSSDSSIHYSHTYSADHLKEKIHDLVHDRFFERHYNSFQELTYESGASWHYDAAGCCKEFHLPHGGTIRYSYEGMHLVSVERLSVRGELLYTHQYTEFDPNGHVQQEELIGNLGTIVTSHDLLERPSSQSSPWLSHVIHYGPSGLVVQTENSLFTSKNYEYDPLNQIEREGEVDYSFDSLGNPISCETNDYNQILAGSDYAFKYDLNGNPYEKTTAEATIRYDYDALGRLTEISSTEKTILYQYDPFSRLYSKKVITPSNSTTIYYIYDKDCEIGTIDENGKLLELKVLGLGLKGDIGAAVAIELEDEIFAPLHDFRGNVIALLSLDGKIVESSDFDAFGREDKPLNTYRNPWRFSSKRTEETGLIFFGFRFYDPILQRFLTPDPSGFTDGPNLYAYTRNNPLSRLDLFGLDSEFLIPLRVEVPFEKFTSVLTMPIPILPCRYVLSNQTVEGFVSCGAFHKLQFAPKDETPKVIDILEHIHLLVAPEGSQISAGSLGNGINTGLKEFHQMFVSTTSKIEEGTLMFAVHNRSKGFFRDVYRLVRELFFGKETRVIRAMQQIITGLSERLSAINKDAILFHLMHSENGLIMYRGCEKMPEKWREQIRSNMLFLGYGLVLPIPKGFGKDVINVYSEKDGLTLGFKNHWDPNATYDIRLVPCVSKWHQKSAFIYDHAFLAPTGEKAVSDLFTELRRDYGFYRPDTR